MTSGQSHQPAKPCGEMILILKKLSKEAGHQPAVPRRNPFDFSLKISTYSDQTQSVKMTV